MADALAGPSAVVVSSDEEIRVLLRGLLHLHRYRVAGEASGEETGLELVRSYLPTLLLVDSRLSEGRISTLIAGSRRIASGLRVVLVTSTGAPRPTDLIGAAAPDVVLERPFRVREFAQALGGPTPPSGPAGSIAPGR